MSDSTAYSFPAYRTVEWIADIIDSQFCFPSVLANVDLTPDYMTASASAVVYKTKSEAAKEQIRRALFRHSLFKIQNAEVTFSCKEKRSLLRVVASPGSISGKAFDIFSKEEAMKFLSEEVWTVDRCGSQRDYFVRYYREGKDGFSTRVIPASFGDKLALLRYYFSS